jgi:L-iditol 2-dehydrogenase
MKAAVLESNKKITLKDVKIPNIKQDECLIKIKFVGICSSDIQRGFFNGAYFYPLIMGHEISGIVEKIGKKVKDFNRGDEVGVFPLLPCKRCEECKKEQFVRCSSYKYYGSRNNGGFAEFLAVKEWNLIKNKNLNLFQLSVLEPFSVCLHAIKLLNLNKKKKKKICIIGAGYLGLIISKILSKTYNSNYVYQIDRNKFKLNHSRSYNKKNFLIKTHNDFLKFNLKNTFDIVIEATGNYDMISKSIDLVSAGGKCVWMGNINQDLKLSRKKVSAILRKEISIFGTWNSNFKTTKISDDWKESIKIINKYKIDIEKLITQFIKLSSLRDIMSKMYSHKNQKKNFDYIKFIVQF